MPDKTFDLGDYVTVPERIALFYEMFAQGRLVTTNVQLTTEPDGKPRVMVEAAAYRTPDDPLPGRGWSWMLLPGTSNFTRGSELENAETSAWGRAIASLGILVAAGIASSQEVASKQEDRLSAAKRDVTHEAPQIAQDGLIGTVEKGKAPVDMEPRQTPNGLAWGFKLKDGSRSFQVLATGSLADVLSMVPDLTGQRVTCYGTIEMIPWDNKAGKAMPPYPRLHLSRIATPDYVLPSELDGAEPEPTEPDTAPLFDDVA